MNKPLNLKYLVAVGCLSLVIITASCGKKDTPAPAPPVTVPDSTNHGPATGFVGFRVDGVRDMAVDTAPHTNVMSIEITPNGPDTVLTALSVVQLPKGVTAVFSKNSGRGAFKTTLHFSYDYSGEVGTHAAAITVRKGDSVKRIGFSVIVPDTTSQGWVFAGHKSSRVISSYVYQPEYLRHLLYSTTNHSAKGTADTGLTFHFDYRLFPLPKKDTTLILSNDNPTYYACGFTLWYRDSSIGWNRGVSFTHPYDTKILVRYFYNGGKPRVKANGVVVQSDLNDTLTRRYISFDLSAY